MWLHSPEVHRQFTISLSVPLSVASTQSFGWVTSVGRMPTVNHLGFVRSRFLGRPFATVVSKNTRYWSSSALVVPGELAELAVVQAGALPETSEVGRTSGQRPGHYPVDCILHLCLTTTHLTLLVGYCILALAPEPTQVPDRCRRRLVNPATCTTCSEEISARAVSSNSANGHWLPVPLR